jgi:hypothetical protein
MTTGIEYMPPSDSGGLTGSSIIIMPVRYEGNCSTKVQKTELLLHKHYSLPEEMLTETFMESLYIWS